MKKVRKNGNLKCFLILLAALSGILAACSAGGGGGGPLHYTVTYDGNGSDSGSVPVDTQGYTDADMFTVQDPGDMARTGFDFVGWNSQADGEGMFYPIGEEFPPLPNLCLYAVWQQRFDIVYDKNGGLGITPVDPNTYGLTAAVLLDGSGLTHPDNTNYKFAGWNTLADGSGYDYFPNDSVNLSGPLYLYANWVRRTYTVSYESGVPITGGALPVDSASYSAGMSDFTFAPSSGFSLDEHGFVEWNTKLDGNGAGYKAASTHVLPGKPDGKYIFYAQWVRTPVISFDGNGSTAGTAPVDIVLAQGTVVALPSAGSLEKSGAHFTGWNTRPDGTGTHYEAGARILLNDDMSLYAEWKVSLIYNANGGSGKMPDILDVYAGETKIVAAN
ncbi:MAG: InlB B-repeat-containing protein, partial [Spirochaetales bacterium]|nr:InlB B-repeat-containing protein [Spirochaetales bacterium]